MVLAASSWPVTRGSRTILVTEEELRGELSLAFQILDLHEFRFDEAPGVTERFLGWSCRVEKLQ